MAYYDTCILIDHLKGVDSAVDLIESDETRSISIITWAEILVGARNHEEKLLLKQFMLSFQVLELTKAIAELAVKIRKTQRMKLPDAIIYATAKANNGFLITRNTKDFQVDLVDVKIPYEL